MDRRVFIIAGIILLIGLSLIAYQQLSAGPVYHGINIDPPKPSADFALQSDQGTMHLSDFQGKFVILHFGYTYCPDVCPTTLTYLTKAFDVAGEAADNFQVIFISVDPRRDTPTHLGEYTRYFNPHFIGVTGTQEEIDKVTGEFGIYYHINDSESTENYSIDHTASLIVLDPQNGQRLIWAHDQDYADIAADMKALARELP